MRKKSVGYLVKFNGTSAYLLTFVHPITGHRQVVRGTVDDGESFLATIIREFQEEAGLDVSTLKCIPLGQKVLMVPGKRDRSGPLEEQMHEAFLFMSEESMPETWIHQVEGDGIDKNDLYQFEWTPVNSELANQLGSEAELFVSEILNYIEKWEKWCQHTFGYAGAKPKV